MIKQNDYKITTYLKIKKKQRNFKTSQSESNWHELLFLNQEMCNYLRMSCGTIEIKRTKFMYVLEFFYSMVITGNFVHRFIILFPGQTRKINAS